MYILPYSLYYIMYICTAFTHFKTFCSLISFFWNMFIIWVRYNWKLLLYFWNNLEVQEKCHVPLLVLFGKSLWMMITYKPACWMKLVWYLWYSLSTNGMILWVLNIVKKYLSILAIDVRHRNIIALWQLYNSSWSKLKYFVLQKFQKRMMRCHQFKIWNIPFLTFQYFYYVLKVGTQTIDNDRIV